MPIRPQINFGTFALEALMMKFLHMPARKSRKVGETFAVVSEVEPQLTSEAHALQVAFTAGRVTSSYSV